MSDSAKATGTPIEISALETFSVAISVESMARALKIPAGYVLLCKLDEWEAMLACGQRLPDSPQPGSLGHDFWRLDSAVSDGVEGLFYGESSDGRTWMARTCRDCGLTYGREATQRRST